MACHYTGSVNALLAAAGHGCIQPVQALLENQPASPHGSSSKLRPACGSDYSGRASYDPRRAAGSEVEGSVREERLRSGQVYCAPPLVEANGLERSTEPSAGLAQVVSVPIHLPSRNNHPLRRPP